MGLDFESGVSYAVYRSSFRIGVISDKASFGEREEPLALAWSVGGAAANEEDIEIDSNKDRREVI